ncbi:MAG TPA: CDP-alcohol phosphatidyltransferase family protein [Balneolales bacterium]|nr:CDP-alcohol phosphatidyltransferase family protein [Balneolales bacterium]
MQAIGNIDGKKFRVRHKIFTISNLISLSRIVIAAPIIYLHYQAGMQTTWAVNLLIIYGVLSDYLDGIVARMTDEISELGKTLDPLADKISALSLFAYLVIIGWIPWWFFYFLIARDVIIASGAMFVRHRRGKIPMSAWPGKITINLIVLYWLSVFYMANYDQLHTVLMWIAAVAMIYSLADYLRRFVLILKGADFN